MMNDPKLGMIIDGQAGRDAIHVAIMPVTAGERLYPGQRIGIFGGKATGQGPYLGIVDPFLAGAVFPDQRFYLCLFPGSITSLRHHWEHPALQEDAEPIAAASDAIRAASERWLRDFVSNANCPNYDELIAAASGGKLEDREGYDEYGLSYRNDGEYFFFNGRDAHGEIPPEFWDHVENVTGKRIGPDKRAEYFSCSC